MSVHLRVPFALESDGTAQLVAQDGNAEIDQCIRVLVGTTRGERLAVPEYGIADPTWGNRVDLEAIAAAVRRWEPRADPFAVAAEIEAAGTVNVRLTRS